MTDDRTPEQTETAQPTNRKALMRDLLTEGAVMVAACERTSAICELLGDKANADQFAKLAMGIRASNDSMAVFVASAGD